MTKTNNAALPEKSADGDASPPADDLRIPDFLLRPKYDSEMPPLMSHIALTEKPPTPDCVMENPAPAPDREPTLQEAIATLERLSKKQEDIERIKNQMKQEIIDRLWQL